MAIYKVINESAEYLTDINSDEYKKLRARADRSEERFTRAPIRDRLKYEDEKANKDSDKKEEKKKPSFLDIFKRKKKHESVDLATDYLVGCLEGSYEIEEELLEFCTDIINENTDSISVDNYLTISEAVDYLAEGFFSKLREKKNAEREKEFEDFKQRLYEKRIKPHEDKANEAIEGMKKLNAEAKEDIARHREFLEKLKKAREEKKD